MNLTESTFFITGASGFIGGRLCEILQPKCKRIVTLVRNPIDGFRLQQLGISVAIGDVCDSSTLASAMRGCDFVCHLAVGHGSLQEATKVNVDGTRIILEAARQSGVKRVLHLSTIAVHGGDLPDLVDEEFPLVEKGNVYELTKAKAERLVEQCRNEYDQDVVVIRPTLVYGPGSETWTVRIVERLRYDEMLLIEAARGIANLIYVDDLVELILMAATHPNAKKQTFIANGTEKVTWRDYLLAYSGMLGKRPPRCVSSGTSAALASFGIWHFRFTRIPMLVTELDQRLQRNKTFFTPRKVYERLGFRARTNLSQGIDITGDWLRATGYLQDGV